MTQGNAHFLLWYKTVCYTLTFFLNIAALSPTQMVSSSPLRVLSLQQDYWLHAGHADGCGKSVSLGKQAWEIDLTSFCAWKSREEKFCGSFSCLLLFTPACMDRRGNLLLRNKREGHFLFIAVSLSLCTTVWSVRDRNSRESFITFEKRISCITELSKTFLVKRNKQEGATNLSLVLSGSCRE